LLHPSLLDFDYTHDLSCKNPIDECQINNGIAIENKIENNEDPKLHMLERDVGLLKEVFIEIIRLMEKVPKIATNVYGSCKNKHGGQLGQAS
jgi:hypothetical protein